MKIYSAAVAILFFAVAAMAQTTNGLSDAEIQGRKLARQLCEARPTENSTQILPASRPHFGQNSGGGPMQISTQRGFLRIRDSKGNLVNVSLSFAIFSTATNWANIYSAGETNGREDLYIVQDANQIRVCAYFTNYYSAVGTNGIDILSLIQDANLMQVCTYYTNIPMQGVVIRYVRTPIDFVNTPFDPKNFSEKDLMMPFADSDFWLCDLGLDFFHWPAQKILKKENRRSRACSVLESTNPNPSTNGYSRVVSWIDEESGGIVFAEAYDANGKKLKEFEPKSFKKVNGQWELKDMEIRNVQTRSRTRIEFDLKKK